MKSSSIQVLKIILLVPFICYAQKGVVIVPVADLLGEPLNRKLFKDYDAFALCGTPQAYNGCPRLHQVLANEVVTIVENIENKTQDEICIEISNAYYKIAQSKHPQTRYWTHKKNILPLSTLSVQEQKKIPVSFDYHTNINDNDIATLVLPWRDTHTGTTFSAGTRFVHVRQHDTPHEYAIYILNPKTYTCTLSLVPKKRALASKQLTHDQQRQQMINILKLWSNQKEFCIPYVWGGTSFVFMSKQTAELEKITKDNYSYFARSDCNTAIKTGLDCSGLITRSAQIVGMPYFYKNTYTIKESLKRINAPESLKIGDILWIPGHVMIVSDIQNNLLIEARSYAHGYGKIHEVPLQKVFNGITTYAELLDAYKNKKTLMRIDKRGEIKDKFSEFALLSLDTIWT